MCVCKYVCMYVCMYVWVKRKVQKSDRINSDRQSGSDQLGSTRIAPDHEKNIKLNETETLTHLKVKIPVKNGPN